MIYLDLGRRELGKTTLLVYMAQRAPFRLYLDPRRMIRTETGVRVSTPEELREGIERMIEGELHEVIVTPRVNIPAMFESVCACVFAWAEDFPTADRALALGLDEARIINNARRPGERAGAHVLETSDVFDQVLRLTPRELIHVIITAHRPQDIPTDIRAIADRWLLFRTTQEHDLKVIEDRCGRACALAVEHLEPFQFVEWNDARGTMQRHSDPKVWFVPLRSAHEAAADIVPDTSHENDPFKLA